MKTFLYFSLGYIFLRKIMENGGPIGGGGVGVAVSFQNLQQIDALKHLKVRTRVVHKLINSQKNIINKFM